MVQLVKAVTEDLIDTYSYGYCMCLATAFHRKYGFEIQAALGNYDGVEIIDHAWVFDKATGTIIDIDGSRDESRNDYVSPYVRIAKNLDESALRQLIRVYHPNPSDSWDASIQDANLVIDEYFK